MKLRKGDDVIVLTGKDRGVTGTIVSVDPQRNRVIVEGVNVAQRHTKPRQQGEPGGIIEKLMPIHASNVAIVNPKDGKATRIGYRINADGTKSRICRRTGDDL